MDAYELHEGRFIQEGFYTSAIAGITVASATVPEGKVRTFRFVSYNPDAAETKVVHFRVVLRSGTNIGIGWGGSIALGPSLLLPLLTDGMELKLYPGEYLMAVRDSATAGSVMGLHVCFIESDLPYYSYEEPQKKVVRSMEKHGSIYRSSGGISSGGGVPSGPGGPAGPRGGGRGGPGESV